MVKFHFSKGVCCIRRKDEQLWKCRHPAADKHLPPQARGHRPAIHTLPPQPHQLEQYRDMPAVEDITYATVQKIRKLLMSIAENVPLGPKKIYLNNTDLMYGTLRKSVGGNVERDILCKPDRVSHDAHDAPAGGFHGRRRESLLGGRKPENLQPDCRPAGQLSRPRRHRDRQRQQDSAMDVRDDVQNCR